MTYYRVTLKSKEDQIKGIEAAAEIGPVQCHPNGRIVVNGKQLERLKEIGVYKAPE